MRRCSRIRCPPADGRRHRARRGRGEADHHDPPRRPNRRSWPATSMAATTPPGVRITGFVQREPGDGVPSSLETTAYLSYDEQHLYAVFVAKDDPGKVRANMTKREAIMGDDIVGLLLDTYHDGRRAYQFMVNPLGIQLDGVTTEGQDDDYSYDTLWQSDGRLTKDGYVVVMKIPFKSLRFSNAETQTWGVAVARSIPRANETSFWPYITRRIVGIRTATGHAGRPGGHLAGAQPPGDSVRQLRVRPRAGRRRRARDRGFGSRRAGRQGGHQGRVHGRPHGEPRLQPGGVGRAAGHGQSAIRGVLSREASVLHRERRVLRDAADAVLLQADRGSRRRCPPHGQGGAAGRSACWASTTTSPAGRSRRETRGAAGRPASASSGCSASSRGSRTWAASSPTSSSARRRTACTAAMPGGSSPTTGRRRASGSAARPSTSRVTRRAGPPGSPRSPARARGFDYTGSVTSQEPRFPLGAGVHPPRGHARGAAGGRLLLVSGEEPGPARRRGHRGRGAVGLWRAAAGLAGRARLRDRTARPDRTGRHVLRGLRTVRGHRVPAGRRDGARQLRVAVVARRGDALLSRKRDQLLPGRGARTRSSAPNRAWRRSSRSGRLRG